MTGNIMDTRYQPTTLVNETYLRLVDINRIQWQGALLAMAARQMRGF